MSKIYAYNPFTDEQDIVLDTSVSDLRYFLLDQTSQQTIIGDFSSLATAYGIKLVPSAGALGTTYGVYADIPGSFFEFEVNYGGYFKAQNAEYSYGIYAQASGASIENWAGYFVGDVRVEGQGIWNDRLHVSSNHQFGSGNFRVLDFGNDLGGLFANTPFSLWYDDEHGYLTLSEDYESIAYQFLKANLYAPLGTSEIFDTTVSTDIVNNTLSSTVSTNVPVTIIGSNSTDNKEATFTYVAPQTFTVTIASPAVLTTPLSHGLTADHCVKLTTTGALPTGLTTTTVYFVRNPSGTTLELSLTAGGASINTSGTQSGTHTITPLAKCTVASLHGRTTNDPIIFSTDGTLPTGITAGTTYYLGVQGLTTTVFYPKVATAGGIANYVAITSAGSGTHYVYGQNTDILQIKNGNGVNIDYIDKYGNFYGNLLTTPWRIGHIPTDSNYSGIWFSTSASSPTSSNYAFLGDTSNTFLNGPTWIFLRTANTNRVTVTSGYIELADATDIRTNATTGTKIGSATSQKLSFWAATPIVQPTTAVAGATRTGGGGTALTDTDTFDGYTVGQVVKALRNTGLLA